MSIDLSMFSRPALQFSGGKDSLACLYLLRDQLENIRVYYLNTGDPCPETHAVVQQVSQWVPRFTEIKTDAVAWKKENGVPSDLVPASAHCVAVAYGMGKVKVSNRFDCCYHNHMLPLHQRMLSDGVDVVIRGTKLSDTGTLPVYGQTEYYNIVLPLKDWTHEDVFAYLNSVGAPGNKIYEHFTSFSSPGCLTCSAWWDDGKGDYLKAKHPNVHKEYVVQLRSLRSLLGQHLVELDSEIATSSN
jgi:phosphoadenosine phosphosulfate reductase